MKQNAPAALRNRAPILRVLARVFPESGAVLEIACGTGQHATHFAAALPGLRWYPTDPSPEACASSNAWTEASGLGNIAPARPLDVRSADWPAGPFAAALCCNMIHIAPWACTEALMAGLGRVLTPGAPFVLYGPFIESDVPTAPSNQAFDANLRSRNPEWGIRSLEAVCTAAAPHGLTLTERVAMPANNLALVFRHTDERHSSAPPR